MTLIEVMTAGGLFLIVLFLILTTLRTAKQAFAQGDGRIVLQQRARIAFARITPLLATAVAPDETKEAVDFPAVVKSFESTAEERLTFYSPIDFFGKQQMPAKRDPRYYHYVIYLEGKTLLLKDLERKELPANLIASRIDSFAVRRVQLNAVNLEVGVSLNNTKKEFRLETLVQIPFYAN